VSTAIQDTDDNSTAIHLNTSPPCYFSPGYNTYPPISLTIASFLLLL
jgi:hypothetical protein